MAQANAGAAGANGAVPPMDGAVLPQIDGAGVRGPGQAAAPVAGPLVAPVAVALLPQGLVPARFDVNGALLGPVPTKRNGSYKILPKIKVLSSDGLLDGLLGGLVLSGGPAAIPTAPVAGPVCC